MQTPNHAWEAIDLLKLTVTDAGGGDHSRRHLDMEEL